MHLYHSVLLALLLSTVAACDKAAKPEDGKTTASSATPSNAATTPPAAASAPAADTAPAVGATAPAAGSGGPATATTITNGAKQVVVNADGGAGNLNLTNQNGSGSVKTTPGGATTVQGKSGKSIVIPPIPTGR